jgi:hypothetical protein
MILLSMILPNSFPLWRGDLAVPHINAINNKTKILYSHRGHPSLSKCDIGRHEVRLTRSGGNEMAIIDSRIIFANYLTTA